MNKYEGVAEEEWGEIFCWGLVGKGKAAWLMVGKLMEDFSMLVM